MFCFKAYGVEIWETHFMMLESPFNFPLPLYQLRGTQHILPESNTSLLQTYPSNTLLLLLRPAALFLSPSAFIKNL